MGLEPIVFRKEMGSAHSEFHRLMPRVARGEHFTFANGRFTLLQSQGRVEIILEPEQERRLTEVFILPYTRIEIHCHGMSEAEAHAFEKHFSFQFLSVGG